MCIRESTYNRREIFDANNLREFQNGQMKGSPDYDFVKITGKVTPMKMYQALYEHNGKILVFDDCDSVLKDETSINILKGALDTSDKRTIEYGSGRKIKDDDGVEIPQRFDFEGQAVFISNLEPDEMPQPLRSRSLCIDLTMTADDTLEMMGTFVEKMPIKDARGNDIGVSSEDRQAAIKFLDKYKDQMDIGDLNARTLGQIALIRDQARKMGMDNWEQMALTTIS